MSEREAPPGAEMVIYEADLHAMAENGPDVPYFVGRVADGVTLYPGTFVAWKPRTMELTSMADTAVAAGTHTGHEAQRRHLPGRWEDEIPDPQDPEALKGCEGTP